MARRKISPRRQGDFAELMKIEVEVFGAKGEGMLGAYYVRLCCEFFAETRIDQAGFEELRGRMERLGLVDRETLQEVA